MSTRGCFDSACPSCKRKYGWMGTGADMPTVCPLCKKPFPKKHLDALLQDLDLVEYLRASEARDVRE